MALKKAFPTAGAVGGDPEFTHASSFFPAFNYVNLIFSGFCSFSGLQSHRHFGDVVHFIHFLSFLGKCIQKIPRECEEHLSPYKLKDISNLPFILSVNKGGR